MGLLTTYDASNRVLEQGKVITYSMTRVKSPYLSWYDDYEYHRYCSLDYQYVGMDLTTANACAAAMITKYTRQYTQGKWDEDHHQYDNDPVGTRCMADIGIQHVAGGMYNVTVAVREDDSKLEQYPQSNMQSLFATENARDYDGY